MIRDEKETIEYKDQDFFKAIEPSENKIKDYCQNKLIYDFFAFLIFTLYKENAIWSNYTLENLYKQALEHLLNDMPKYENLNFSRLDEILEKKYSINIKNKNPIKIEELEIY